MFRTVKHSLGAEAGTGPAHKLPRANDWTALAEKEKQRHGETSPSVTCGQCAMEFKRCDLPPGSKCPVCGQSLFV
jgi:hypothetical protein